MKPFKNIKLFKFTSGSRSNHVEQSDCKFTDRFMRIKWNSHPENPVWLFFPSALGQLKVLEIYPSQEPIEVDFEGYQSCEFYNLSDTFTGLITIMKES